MTRVFKIARLGARAAMGDEFGEMLDDLFSASDQADPADNVGVLAAGSSTSSADFTSVNGVCKARNFPALAYVKEFQSQLNRVAHAKGWSKIGVDGAVGPGTMALFAKVQAASGGSVMGTSGSCMGVAPDVDVIGEQVKALADTLGAPAMVSPPLLSSLKPTTIVTKSGKTVVPAGAGAGVGNAFAGLSSVQKLAVLGVAAGIGYMLWTDHKAPSKRGSSS